MTKPPRTAPFIEVRLEGPAVAGRVSVDTLAAVAKELQTSLRRMLASPRRGRGRFHGAIEQACALDLTAFAPGSAVLTFEYAGPRTADTLQGDQGARVAAEMLDAMQQAEAGASDWREGLPAGLIEGWESMTRSIGDGVDVIHLRLVDDGRRHEARLTRRFRVSLTAPAVAEGPAPEQATIEGVLWECDWKQGTALLDEADGHRVTLQLPEGMDECVTELRRQRVRVRGSVQRQKDRIVRMHVVHLAPAQGGVHEPDPRFGGFWDNLTLDEIARRQGVQAVTDLDALAIDWPADESVDDFLAAIRELRGS
jgi:hypothetical protein